MKLQQSMVAMIVAGSLSLGLSAPRTIAATRYVWQDSPSPAPPYTNWATAAHVIQHAVDTAQAGDTVLVTNGVYAVGAVAVVENQTNRVALINPVILQSVNGPDVTVIQGAAAPDGSNGDGSIRCVYVGTNAILSGFTLSNGHAVIGGGVWCEASGVVTNCTLTGNSASDGGGAVGGTLYNCALRGNSAQSVGGGAYASTLYNSTLNGNSADNGGGAFQSTLYSCTLTLNSAQGAGGGVGGNRPYGVYSSLYNCIVYHNTAPQGPNYSDSTFLFSCTSPLPQGEGNIDADPQLASGTHLSASSPCIGAGSATNISGVDIDGEPWADPPCIGADQFTSGNATGPILVSVEAVYTNVAVGFAVPFTGLFEGRFTSSVWDFGDGTVRSNQPATSHAWSTPGTYAVTLRGFNESFPQGVASQLQVTVVEQPVHYVNKANPTPEFPYVSWQTAATNIQDAVDAATFPGRLVLVTNGVYDVGGGINGSRVALTNPVVLRSVNGPEVTTVVGGGEFSYLRCVYVGANATLSGFTITNGYAAEGGGVWCESSGAVSNCVISGNSVVGTPGFGGGAFGGTLSDCTLIDNFARGYRLAAGYGGGAANAALYNCVLAGNSANGFGGGAAESTLHDCVVTGNSTDGFDDGYPGTGGGVYGGTLYNCVLTGNSAKFWGRLGCGGGAASATLHNCVLNGNSAAEGGGAAGGTLNNCILTRNSAEFGGGVYGDEWIIGPAILHNCIVYYNTAENGPNYFGSTLDYSCTTPLPTNGVGNIDADPQLVSTTHLSANSPCIGAGSAAYASGVDIDGEPWANPPCIGADQLTPGSATGPLAMEIQASDIHTKPGYVVSFTVLNTGPIFRSVWDLGDGTRVTNRPFVSHAWSEVGIYTVRLTGYNDTYPDGITTSLTMAVSDGVSYVNQAISNPVPPYTSWDTAATRIQDAIEVAAVGGVVWVTNGVYANGSATWADTGDSRVAIKKAVRVQSVNGPRVTMIRGDDVTRCVYLGTNAILSGFTLTNGHTDTETCCFAISGGGVLSETSGIVINCVLTGNSAVYGGGAFGGTLINCTITGNFANNEGGGVSGSTLYNCIVHSNLFSPNYSGGTFLFSNTTPLPEGEGNIDADPLFVNLAAGDLRLRPDSPCIDAGTDLSAFLTTDLDALPRPLDGNGDGVARFDMGAYEFNPYHFMPTLQFSTNGFQFTVRGEPGKSVRIERSRDLVHWEFAGQVPIPASGQTLIDPSARTERQLFYRAVSIP